MDADVFKSKVLLGSEKIPFFPVMQLGSKQQYHV